MRIRKPDDVPSSEITHERDYRDRRRFLVGAAAGSIALAAGRTARAAAGAAEGASLPKPVQKSEWRLPDEAQTPWEDATRYNNFYEFGTDKESPAKYAPRYLKTRPWTVKVDGACAKPGTVDIDALIRPHGLEERVYRHRCVEAWSMVIPWVGIPLGAVLARFEPSSNAKYVAFETLHDPAQMPGQKRSVLDWPYVEGLRIDEAMHPLAILAVGMYGRVMPAQNGAPVRLVVPWKYGFKGIKSIVRISFTEKQPPTSWNEMAAHEYGFYANVNPDVDHPRWSQARERRIGEFSKRATLPFNGYAEQVAGLYRGLDLKKNY